LGVVADEYDFFDPRYESRPRLRWWPLVIAAVGGSFSRKTPVIRLWRVVRFWVWVWRIRRAGLL
jgi:hypothetical protein